MGVEAGSSGESGKCGGRPFILVDERAPLDTAFMLALEEAMVHVARLCGYCLAAIWTDRPALVAGRTSRLDEEVDAEAALREGVPIYRRITGGGTVYHDPGNLNVTVVLPFRIPVEEAHTTVAWVVAEAVESLGLTPRLENEGDVVVGGWKVSGSAVYLAGTATLAHATLLVEADLDAAYRMLRPLWRRIAGGAATPVKYRPANIAALSPGVTVGEARMALSSSLRSLLGASLGSVDADVYAALHGLAWEFAPIYRSMEWRLRGRRRQSFSTRVASSLLEGALECPYTRGPGTTAPRSARRWEVGSPRTTP